MNGRLEDLPNTGPVLADRLCCVGVMTAGQFAEPDDAATFGRLVATYPEDACGHAPLALAGAARGIRWHGEFEPRQPR